MLLVEHTATLTVHAHKQAGHRVCGMEISRVDSVSVEGTGSSQQEHSAT